MHAKFPANVPHQDGKSTKFLALDKCMPGKRFLQIIDIPQTGDTSEPKLSFDAEWMGILRDTNHLWHFENSNQYMPGPIAGSDEKYDFTQTDEQLEEVKRLLGSDLTVDPSSFQRTGPVHETAFGDGFFSVIIADMKAKNYPLPPVTAYVNPQTTELCQKLGLTNPLKELMGKAPKHDPRDFTSDFMAISNNQGHEEEKHEVVDTEAVTVYFEEGRNGEEESGEEPIAKKIKIEGEVTAETPENVKEELIHYTNDAEIREVVADISMDEKQTLVEETSS